MKNRNQLSTGKAFLSGMAALFLAVVLAGQDGTCSFLCVVLALLFFAVVFFRARTAISNITWPTSKRTSSQYFTPVQATQPAPPPEPPSDSRSIF